MKKKSTRHIMIIAVALIWLIVLWKIVAFFIPQNSVATNVTYAKKKIIKIEEKDSFNIKANYPDPFLKKGAVSIILEEENTDKQPEKETKTQSKTKKIPTLKWPDIHYGGVIMESNSSSIVALVKIEGKECLMKEQDCRNEICLLQVYNDSIVMEYKEESRTMYKNK